MTPTIPDGPILGRVRVEFVTPKGSVTSRTMNGLHHKNVRSALDLGHRFCARYHLGTYRVEVEIFGADEEAS